MGKTKKRGRPKGRSKGRSKGRGRSPVTRAVTRSRQRRAAVEEQSFVVIIGGRVAQEENAIDRVAKVLAISRDKSKYALRLNYNGQVMILKRENLRKATEPEEDADPILHNRDRLTFIEEMRERL